VSPSNRLKVTKEARWQNRRRLEALWLRKLMADLGEPITPVPIAEDGQACLALIANPEGTGRTKHIDVCHHLVRERTEMGEV